MIVKVQFPIVGSGPALIYDEARQHQMLHPIDTHLRRMMGADKKAYFQAAWDEDAKRFTFGKRVEGQGW